MIDGCLYFRHLFVAVHGGIAMARNVEIKARVNKIDDLEQRVARISNGVPLEIIQDDASKRLAISTAICGVFAMRL